MPRGSTGVLRPGYEALHEPSSAMRRCDSTPPGGVSGPPRGARLRDRPASASRPIPCGAPGTEPRFVTSRPPAAARSSSLTRRPHAPRPRPTAGPGVRLEPVVPRFLGCRKVTELRSYRADAAPGPPTPTRLTIPATIGRRPARRQDRTRVGCRAVAAGSSTPVAGDVRLGWPLRGGRPGRPQRLPAEGLALLRVDLLGIARREVVG